MENNIKFMNEALKEAKKAENKNEVPIGAVIVNNNKIIARAHNTREKTQNAIAHAEVLAIQKACKKLNTWRLEGCTMYVTLEPCPMCAGAMILSRVENVVFGAYDPKSGCAGTLMNFLEDNKFNHKVKVTGGVLEKECGDMLRSFFQKIRKKNS